MVTGCAAGAAGAVEGRERAAETTALATGTVHVWWIPLVVDRKSVV